MANSRKTAPHTLTDEEIRELEAQVDRLMIEQRSLNRRAASLQRRNLRLEELNKLKDEFIAVASHQLRTPATAVKQYLGLLLEGYSEPLADSQRLFLERAFESNERQLNIVDDLLQIARIDSESFSLKLSRTWLRDIIRQAAQELDDKLAKKQQTIAYSFPKKKIPVLADPQRLMMVFENLIDNAINYSPEHTVVRVHLHASKGYALIDFTDRGVGIDRRDFPKLFQKFSRIPNPLSVEVGGTGLGLYWAYKIVQLHGGDIKVKSKLGEGTTFTVIFPIAANISH